MASVRNCQTDSTPRQNRLCRVAESGGYNLSTRLAKARCRPSQTPSQATKNPEPLQVSLGSGLASRIEDHGPRHWPVMIRMSSAFPEDCCRAGSSGPRAQWSRSRRASRMASSRSIMACSFIEGLCGGGSIHFRSRATRSAKNFLVGAVRRRMRWRRRFTSGRSRAFTRALIFLRSLMRQLRQPGLGAWPRRR